MKSLISLGLLSIPIHAAVIIDGFNAAEHDRFANDPSFIASSKNLTGVGRLSSIPSGADMIMPWATMISNARRSSCFDYAFPSSRAFRRRDRGRKEWFLGLLLRWPCRN